MPLPYARHVAGVFPLCENLVKIALELLCEPSQLRVTVPAAHSIPLL